jgi:stage V sporulation protein G
MEVTEVRVFIADEDDERLKAYATVTFDNCFVVRDLKVINGNNGLFVAMPSKKRKDGTYKDVAHPINQDFRELVEKKVLIAYQDETKSIEAGVRPAQRVSDYERDEVVASVPYAARDFEDGVAPAKK